MKYLRKLKPKANFGFGNRKGSVFDIAIVMAVLFAFAMTFLIGHYVMTEVGEKVKPILESEASNITNASSGITTTMTRAMATLDLLDYAFLALFVGLLLFIILTSFQFQAHPAFFILFLIFAAIIVVIAVALSNAYEEIEQVPVLASSQANFPITSHILGNFPLYILIMAFISIIVVYAKSRATEGTMP